MRLLLDANVVLFGLTGAEGAAAELIDKLQYFCEEHEFVISLQVFLEVQRNLPSEFKVEFKKLVNEGAICLDVREVKEELIAKYLGIGLKKGDILIAAFAEQVCVDCIVSENRHFIKEFDFSEFKVITPEELLEVL